MAVVVFIAYVVHIVVGIEVHDVLDRHRGSNRLLVVRTAVWCRGRSSNGDRFPTLPGLFELAEDLRDVLLRELLDLGRLLLRQRIQLALLVARRLLLLLRNDVRQLAEGWRKMSTIATPTTANSHGPPSRTS